MAAPLTMKVMNDDHPVVFKGKVVLEVTSHARGFITIAYISFYTLSVLYMFIVIFVHNVNWGKAFCEFH